MTKDQNMALTPEQKKEMRDINTRLKLKTEELERLKLERIALQERRAELIALRDAESATDSAS